MASGAYFYPRSPCGERQDVCLYRLSLSLFLSTLSLRRATHYDNYNLHCVEISIHALLAESDSPRCGWLEVIHYFYPRSPCGERRWLRCWQLAARDISIHALLAESDNGYLDTRQRDAISIHALLAESDEPATRRHNKHNIFLSTLSLRRATAAGRFLLS